MAQTTYQLPLSDQQRAVDAMRVVFDHLQSWKAKYNIDFLSCIRNGPNLDVTFSDAIPQGERTHIRLALS